MDLVSVVVPTYNVEKYLERCVESIRSQTYSTLEIILVDDGSTDRSGAMCDELAKHDDRIRVIHKENGGLSDARNFGLAEATGEYVCFIDSDDWVEPDMISSAVDALKKENSDIAIWGYYADFVDAGEKILSSSKRILREEPHFDGENPYGEIGSVLGFCGYAWNKLYRLPFLKEQQLTFTKGISLVEDILFNAKAICRAESVTFLPTAYNHYMQRNAETLGTKFYPNLADLRLMALDAHVQLLHHWDVSQAVIDQYRARRCCEISWAAIKAINRTGKTSGERKVLIHEVLADPRLAEKAKADAPTWKSKVKHWFVCKKRLDALYLVCK